jgi:FlaA1/EpsC-like NDP-sugar epimerase
MMMPTCRIIDLAEVLVEALGRKNVTIKELGIRPGEKIHEILYSEYESPSTVVYDSQYLVILPTLDIPGLKQTYAGYPKADMLNYCSSEGLMNKEQIKRLLVKGRFLP